MSWKRWVRHTALFTVSKLCLLVAVYPCCWRRHSPPFDWGNGQSSPVGEIAKGFLCQLRGSNCFGLCRGFSASKGKVHVYSRYSFCTDTATSWVIAFVLCCLAYEIPLTANAFKASWTENKDSLPSIISSNSSNHKHHNNNNTKLISSQIIPWEAWDQA